ncbi:MAG: TonB-dependent receptor [Candidatus Ozemobacteraceae bacterium]
MFVPDSATISMDGMCSRKSSLKGEKVSRWHTIYGCILLKLLLCICVIVFPASPCFASLAASSALDINLEDLMKIEITSASKKPQRIGEIPSAVYVITSEDIHRSGATSIPEVLRMAPGVQVLAVSNNKWSISIRGGAREFSNKLLVLVDGRSVYSPLFSGVFWEALEVPVENIERIEVVRGPGASIWGPNAVNGVINIITKSAEDTQGTFLSAKAGDHLAGSGLFRYGCKASDGSFIRTYAQGFSVVQSRQIDGSNGEDAWRNRNAGFRMDRLQDKERFMLQGNAFDSRDDDEANLVTTLPNTADTLYSQTLRGVNLTARWDMERSKELNSTIQATYDHTDLHHAALDEDRTTFSLDYQQRCKPARIHDVVWGGGLHLSHDKLDDTPQFTILEKTRLSSLYRIFVNDEITLKPDRWHLTLGMSLDHNNYTHYEVQPTVRLLYTPDPQTGIWTSYSRGVRTPSRLERGASMMTVASAPPMPVVIASTLDNTAGEKLDSFEYGYRRQFSSNLNLDLSGFVFKYYDLINGNGGIPSVVFPPGYLLVPGRLENESSATVQGGETSLDWNASKKWRLKTSYSLTRTDLHKPAGGQDPDVSNNVPSHLLTILSSVDLNPHLAWDTWMRQAAHIETGDIPGYTTVDTRLAWNAKKNLELSIVCQNMFDKKHREFQPVFILSKPRDLGRTTYVKAEWRL